MAAACSFKVFMDLFTDQYLEIVEQSYKGAEMKDIVCIIQIIFSQNAEFDCLYTNFVIPIVILFYF